MRRQAFGAICLAVLVAAPVWAHHNMSALFDFNQRFTVTGALTDLDWRNPHIFMFVDVENDAGKSERWTFEGPPPGFFRNRAFTREDFEASLGKSVTVEASRARDGSMSGLIRQVTLTDGRTVSACPQNC
ncbi:MAG: DUF6152 family protein [Gammaproteobacteria bacterium]